MNYPHEGIRRIYLRAYSDRDMNPAERMDGGDPHEMPCELPSKRATSVIVTGRRCECGADPLEIAGTGRHKEFNDYGTSESAACVNCRGDVGTLVVEFDTIFGFTEDERVRLKGPKVF